MIKVINDNGRPWAIETDDELVTFYDCRYEHKDLGQFVSRYYIKTIMEMEGNSGLCLDGGVPEWTISHSGMNRIRAWIKAQQATKYFTVFVDGEEVSEFHLIEEHASMLAEQYRTLGYNGVGIERV